jgi:AraC-like DNA-binding protein
VDRLRRRQVFGADGFPLAGAIVVLDGPVEEHTHDFLEVAVLLAGAVTYLSPGGRRSLEAGAVTAVRPGGWHGYAEPDEAEIGNLYLGEELLHAELRWLLDIGDLGRFLLRGGLSVEHLGRSARQTVRGRLAELAGVRAVPGTASAIEAVGLSCGVLGSLANIALAAGSHPAFSPPVRRVLVLLGEQPARPWTVSELAAEVGLSVSHLHREFRSQLGLSPMAWLARTRAELAASLLLQTDRPIGWVGRQVGWSDSNYFSRCFRRAYRMSPSTYRARNTDSSRPADRRQAR